MTTFREDFLELADELRSLSGPDPDFDIRTSQLTIRSRTWLGGKRGATGGYTDSDLEIPRKYRIRQMEQNEIASAGGRYEAGDVLVGPITPEFPGPPPGGYTEAQLKPRPTTDATEIIYLITGAHAGEYRLIELRSMRAFGYELVIRRTRATP